MCIIFDKLTKKNLIIRITRSQIDWEWLNGSNLKVGVFKVHETMFDDLYSRIYILYGYNG